MKLLQFILALCFVGSLQQDIHPSTDACPISPEEACGVVNSKEYFESLANVSSGISKQATVEGSAPWAVRLYHRWKNMYICGGIILNYEWVITAAQCVSSQQINGPEDLAIIIGDYDDSEKGPDEEMLYVYRIEIHPEFEQNFLHNDIALIHLWSNIRHFTNYVRPICLPSVCLAAEFKTPHALMRFHGWGKNSKNRISPRYMKELVLPLLAFKACNQSGNFILESMICVDHDDNGEGTCDGDGGGGLVREYLGRWYLIGIGSWGDGCGVPGNYDYFTDVLKFRKWIIDIINDK